MEPTIVVALLSLMGTLAGSALGVWAQSRLTAYRIGQLEKKMDKHNNLIERMGIAEQSVKSAHRRIDEIKEAI